MDIISHAFRAAQQSGNGYVLAETLTPLAPSQQPNLLRLFYRSTNAAKVNIDIRHSFLFKDKTLGLSSAEGNAWVDVYVTYWKAIGAVLTAEDELASKGQVRFIFHHISRQLLSNFDMALRKRRMTEINDP
jgi:hypothetical protein